jgi:hypothetical protein
MLVIRLIMLPQSVRWLLVEPAYLEGCVSNMYLEMSVNIRTVFFKLDFSIYALLSQGTLYVKKCRNVIDNLYF